MRWTTQLAWPLTADRRRASRRDKSGGGRQPCLAQAATLDWKVRFSLCGAARGFRCRSWPACLTADWGIHDLVW